MSYVAIILPVFLSGITFIAFLKFLGKDKLSYPLDLTFKYRGKRIFGKNKTIRGPIIMAFFTGLYGFLLTHIFKLFKLDFNPHLSRVSIFSYYSLVGLLYSLGELPNSFIKRQLDIPPGEVSGKRIARGLFGILDTTDSLIACGIVYYYLFKFPLTIILKAIIIGSFIHLLTDQLMVKLSLKRKS